MPNISCCVVFLPSFLAQTVSYPSPILPLRLGKGGKAANISLRYSIFLPPSPFRSSPSNSISSSSIIPIDEHELRFPRIVFPGTEKKGTESNRGRVGSQMEISSSFLEITFFPRFRETAGARNEAGQGERTRAPSRSGRMDADRGTRRLILRTIPATIHYNMRKAVVIRCSGIKNTETNLNWTGFLK